MAGNVVRLWIFNFIFFLVIYIVVIKFDLILIIKTKIFKKPTITTEISTSPTKNILSKKVMIIMITIGTIFLLLTAVSAIVNSKSEKISIPNLENSNTKKEEQQKAGCGN